jgi:hypothetical protein
MGGIAVDGMSIRGNTKHANKLMTFSRRLNSGDGDDMDDEERASYFLKDYSIKLLSCIQGEQAINYENGEVESSTVVYRLCPSDSCDSTASVLGCDEGYGDYAVGIDSFLEAYREGQRDEHEEEGEEGEESNNPMIVYNQYGQEFDASEYMECSEYRQEEGEEENEGEDEGDEQQQNYQQAYNYYQDMQFFIGPGCSADGKSIALHTYMDEDCTYMFEGNFSQISPQWESLPFSDGGLVSMDCVACYGAKDDEHEDENEDEDGEDNMEVSEMCQQEFQSSFVRCEQTMNDTYYHYTSSAGCDYVDSLLVSVYGNMTVDDEDKHSALDTVKTAVSGASKSFMDTMSTEEARAFIAGMVVFALSFLVGVGFITCLCVKKRRQRKVLKKKLLDDSGSEDESSVTKRHSSIAALVRSSTNSIKESVVAAATGTKVAVATAAAATVAAVTNTKDEDDATVKSEYNNMEDAPEPASEETPATTEETSPAVATEKKGGFLSKMDKHLKKKLSLKKK